MTLPALDDDLADRQGLDPDFLGVRVPLPRPRDPAVATVLLRYTHFEVLLRPDRRLAAVTGVGIDGESLRDLDRAGISWRRDPRVAPEEQTDDALYARNDLDRGHLVRRRAAVWGEDAATANVDTFFFPNCAPQASDFNQGRDLWLGLEDHLLANAATFDRRLVVLTGPVLAEDDPLYRGVAVPRRFFKVAAFRDAGGLAATAYVLDQSPQLEEVLVPEPGPGEPVAGDEAPPALGPFRTFQVPVPDVAAMTGLDLDLLAAVDRPPQAPPPPEGDRTPSGWLRLERLEQVRTAR
ncbi:DNA/RNA non-specific endonuclease [Pseudokineococcus sp. 1T1Z-3]|uniref:DNA/RNA non-specific endonuclease n=1 Tax=Pseudokineococcus sp. 1T1Z-3 TaxID=3132745 RepID=UPI0030A44269